VFDRLIPTIYRCKDNEFALTRIMVDIAQTIHTETEQQDKIIKEFYINLILSMFKDTIIADKEVNRFIIESIMNYHTPYTETPLPFEDYDLYLGEDEIDDYDSDYDSEDNSDSDVSDDSENVEDDISINIIISESDDDEEDSENNNTHTTVKVLPKFDTITKPEIDYNCVITGEDCSKTGGYIINKHNNCEPKVILSEEGFMKYFSKREIKCIYCRHILNDTDFTRVLVA
jgi:hypothetical protein